MADNYLQPVNNHFDFNNAEDLEDVDDDIFLNNARNNRNNVYGSNATMGAAAAPRSTNPFEDPQQQMYAEKRRQIENRTLESTQKSLGLLYETEDVGKATAFELAKQREQLEKTSRQLDEINSTLRFSQRHLNGLKSVFGGLKNYLSGARDAPTATASPSGSNQDATSISTTTTATVKEANVAATKEAISPTERYDNHPISRLRDNSAAQNMREQTQMQRSNNPFQSQLDANLEEMCGNLSRLKGLAMDMGTEIETQNELLDNMNYKIEDVDLKMGKQNKDINKLLKK